MLTSSSVFAQGAHQSTIDRGLKASLRRGAATQNVIITVKAGYRADIRQALETHGDRIRGEHPLIEALSVEIHSGDVEEVSKHPWVEAMSLDATVNAGIAPSVDADNIVWGTADGDIVWGTAVLEGKLF